jgi:hypothetical protein
MYFLAANSKVWNMSGPSGQHLILVPAEIQGNKNLQGSAFQLIFTIFFI